MKSRKALLGVIGFSIILLTAAVPSWARSCSRCNAQQHQQHQVQHRYQAQEQYRHQAQEQYRYQPPVVDRIFLELKYRDGFPGPRQYKRIQVKKLQCMLNALGYCSGPIDGWYGQGTAKGVRCFLRANTQEGGGSGYTLSWRQWLRLESLAGAQCSRYNISI